MSAKHAMLGVLLDRPAYPYQLADQLEQRLGPAWKVNSGQVYQTIKALEQDGLIERVQSVPSDREDRHVFAITDEGVLEFQRWFEKTASGVRLCRRPLLVQITFAGQQRLRDAMAKVDAYELECAKQLKDIVGMRDALPADGALIRADHLLLRLSLSADISQVEGELRWARHAREMLSWLSTREAVWPSDRERPVPAAQRRDRGGSARRELFERMAADESGDKDG
jgi:PadR family transcriptional regulator, phenolic acid-responsive transcriptional regulator